jgi:hypothetical protein
VFDTLRAEHGSTTSSTGVDFMTFIDFISMPSLPRGNRTPRINRMLRLYEPLPKATQAHSPIRPRRPALHPMAAQGSQVLHRLTLVVTALAGVLGALFVASLLSMLPFSSVADTRPLAQPGLAQAGLATGGTATSQDTSLPSAATVFAGSRPAADGVAEALTPSF